MAWEANIILSVIAYMQYWPTRKIYCEYLLTKKLLIYVLFFLSVFAQSLYPQFAKNRPKHFHLGEMLPGATKRAIFVEADFNMEFIWIFNNVGTDTFVSEPSNSFIIPVGLDTFDIMTGLQLSKHKEMILYKKNITEAEISFSLNEADLYKKISLVRKDGSDLRINSMQFFFVHTHTSGFGLSDYSLDSSAFYLFYNNFPDYLENTWSVKGKRPFNDNKIYLLNGPLKSNPDDSLISNDPIHYSEAEISFHVPDSILEESPNAQVSIAYPSGHYYPNDGTIKVPVTLDIVQDTLASRNLLTSKMTHWLNTAFDYEYRTVKSYYGAEHIYLKYGTDENDVYAIPKEGFKYGLTPTFWNGRFFNSTDSIIIRAPHAHVGYGNYMFLSQTNDDLNVSPFFYSLKKNDELIEKSTWGRDLFWYKIIGVDSDSLEFGYGPGVYDLECIHYKNEVFGKAGICSVSADFNTTVPDKNPPFISAFQITSNGQLSAYLKSSEENNIRILADDEYGIFKSALYLKHEESMEWREVNLFKHQGFYVSQVPDLMTGFYHIKYEFIDQYGNSLEGFVFPAFYYDAAVSIEDHEVQTQQDKKLHVFPNPFNSATKINFTLSQPQVLFLYIYNINGQQLVRDDLSFNFAGEHSLNLDLSNYNGNFSAGTYFVVIKGKDFYKISKALYIK